LIEFGQAGRCQSCNDRGERSVIQSERSGDADNEQPNVSPPASRRLAAHQSGRAIAVMSQVY
jgi:hypothetical protein